MAGLPSLPPVLKPVQHYLKTAAEHDIRDPVVAYYCRFYALQSAMEIDKKSPESRQFIIGMMDFLEQVKTEHADNEAIHSDVVGQVHLENYACKVFLYADNEDRAGRFNKNVVKSFYTAGMLFDVMQTFGELNEQIESNRKYAKWKAAYIHRCLKAGQTPIAGPLPEDGEEGAAGGAPPPPQPAPSSQPQQPNYLQQPQNTYPQPPSGAHAPPSTPSEPAYPSMPSQPPAQPAPVPAPRQQVWVPPSNPSAAPNLRAEEYQRAMKYSKYACSALQYEDSATAIENLTKALRLLTTGQDK